ncbi:MAG: MlaD family protein [Pseudonocardia sp.]
MNRLAPRVMGGLLVGLAVVGVGVAVSNGSPYTYSAVLPSSDPLLIEGTPIYVHGFESGLIEDIRPEGNQAVVTFSLDPDIAPLHDGAYLNVEWKALVGERLLFVADGPETNAEIPDGGMIEGKLPRPTQVADVLAALDPATRESLSSLVNRLNTTFEGSERDFNETVRTAGPALAAVGEVLRGVGADGPVITKLVTDLNAMLATVAGREDDFAAVIRELSVSSAATAAERDELAAALQRLPGTFKTAQSTLERIPGVTEEVLPLLDDLESATGRLPGAARELDLALDDLRPLARDLKPTLDALATFLNVSPELLATLGDGTLRDLGLVAANYTPFLDSLRPCAPDITGFLVSWGSAGQNQDANGKYMRIFAQGGPATPTINPGFTTPGVSGNLTQLCGSADDSAGNPGAGEAVDAGGEGVR